MRHRLSLLLLAVAFSPVLSAQSNPDWDPDYDGDNVIGVTDLLGLLGVFEEQDSDGDGIFDSQDDCVGVYDPCGVCNGAGVDADLDGVCDDLDDCVGAYDECGVCNGPGPDWPVVESIELSFDSAYIEQIDFWFVYQTDADTTFSYVCPPSGCTDAVAANFDPSAVLDDGSCSYGPEQCGGASTVTYDGHTYDLVAIGDQCWFAENLRSEHYANGDAIPSGISNSSWENTTSGAVAFYNNDVGYLETYGRLYNWYAVDNSRGLCPSGWHVPTDGEWTALTDHLGGSSVAGSQLKSSPSDSPSWDGTNSSGFSALPGGRRLYDGNFSLVGYSGYWWSASPNLNFAWFRNLYSDVDNVSRSSSSQRSGLSVRCVRD